MAEVSNKTIIRPLVSVLMSVYNGENYLAESIESVLEQTFTDIEFIIVDDGSNDSTPDILSQYASCDSRILIHRLEKNQGITRALNYGMKFVRGEYIARMDADDISLPNRIHHQVLFMDTNPDVAVCGTWAETIGNVFEKFEYPESHDAIHARLIFTNAFAHPSVMMRTSSIKEHSLFYDNDARYAQDYELWSRAVGLVKLANISKYLLKYRVHSESIAAKYNHEQLKLHHKIYRKLLAPFRLPVSGEFLDLHYKIGTHQYGCDIDFLSSARHWLEMIVRSNQKNQIISRKILDIELGKRWTEICEFSQVHPIRVFSIVLSSSLIFRGGSGIFKINHSILFLFRKLMTTDQLRKDIKRFVEIVVGERQMKWVSSGLRKIKQKLFKEPGGLFSIRLQRKIPPKFKIGMAVLVHERPEYLELCLESLFNTQLHNYDITFLIHDDGSEDPRVRELIERRRDPKYKIVRYYSPKSHNSWGAAFNHAVKKLLEIDDFDIVGTCDSDALFHPGWLNETMKICLWAKEHHCEHILGPFSSFNSSDYEFHQILGTYSSPYGKFVVKRRMGALNYFYFTKDLQKLGFFEEDKDDETLMTKKFEKLGVRNYCTYNSYIEHIGHISILNEWRPVPVTSAVFGMNLASGFGDDLAKADTLGYYRFIKKNQSFDENVSSNEKIDVLIPVIKKDFVTLPYVVEGVRQYLRHPIGEIIIVAPQSLHIRSFCEESGCVFVNENEVTPIKKSDIDYVCGGVDRSGWLYQQFIKLSGDKICAQENYLTLDADTILVSPQVFIANGKAVLLHSDEHHPPYFQVYFKLFGVRAPTNLSFIAHQMIFNRSRLTEMKNHITNRHNKLWYEAILDVIDISEFSAFSDFETYGQWMLQKYPGEIIREYWFNKSVNRSQFYTGEFSNLTASSRYRSISFHSDEEYPDSLAKKIVSAPT